MQEFDVPVLVTVRAPTKESAYRKVASLVADRLGDEVEEHDLQVDEPLQVVNALATGEWTN